MVRSIKDKINKIKNVTERVKKLKPLRRSVKGKIITSFKSRFDL